MVVMVGPDADRLAALLFGVEAFFGEDPLVALDFLVVPGRVRLGPLMPRSVCGHCAEERLRAIVGAVVSGHLDQMHDAVSSEEGPSPAEQGDGGCCGLVLQGLGVREARVAVDRRVQSSAHASIARPRAAAPVESPAATGGDLPDFLHVQAEHVAGEAGDDLPGLAVALPGRVEVTAARDSEVLQPSADGADAVVVAAAGELEGDPAGRPFAVLVARRR